MASCTSQRFWFIDIRSLEFDQTPPHQAKAFRCPECQVEVFPQNVSRIECLCGAEGNKQHFSSVELERKAA